MPSAEVSLEDMRELIELVGVEVWAERESDYRNLRRADELDALKARLVAALCTAEKRQFAIPGWDMV